MEKQTKRYTVTTVLEYDKDGDVVREERCEDTEYYEPDCGPKTTCTPYDGYVDYPIGNPITHPYVTYSAMDLGPSGGNGLSGDPLMRT